MIAYPVTVEARAKANYIRFTLAAAGPAAAVATYCDHAEHNEVVAAGWVIGAAEALLRLALEIAETEEVDLLELYGSRLAAIEAQNVLVRSGGFDGAGAAARASSWRELQLVQMDHDRSYHPDVLGLARLDQLRHYALHVSKIVGALADRAAGTIDREQIVGRRLPDTLLFALKLHTVMGVRLSDDPLPGSPPRLDRPA